MEVGRRKEKHRAEGREHSVEGNFGMTKDDGRVTKGEVGMWNAERKSIGQRAEGIA